MIQFDLLVIWTSLLYYHYQIIGLSTLNIFLKSYVWRWKVRFNELLRLFRFYKCINYFYFFFVFWCQHRVDRKLNELYISQNCCGNNYLQRFTYLILLLSWVLVIRMLFYLSGRVCVCTRHMYSKKNNKNQTCTKHNVLLKRNESIFVRQRRIAELRNITKIMTFLVTCVQVVSALIGNKSRVIKTIENKYARKTDYRVQWCSRTRRQPLLRCFRKTFEYILGDNTGKRIFFFYNFINRKFIDWP